MRIFAVVGLAALVCTQAVGAEDRLEIAGDRVAVQGLLDDQGVIRVGAALGFMLPRGQAERVGFNVPVRATGQLLPGSRVMGQRTVFRLARAEVSVVEAAPVSASTTPGLVGALGGRTAEDPDGRDIEALLPLIEAAQAAPDDAAAWLALVERWCEATPGARERLSLAEVRQLLHERRRERERTEGRAPSPPRRSDPVDLSPGAYVLDAFEAFRERPATYERTLVEALRSLNHPMGLSREWVAVVDDLRRAAAATSAFDALQALVVEVGGDVELAWFASCAGGGSEEVQARYRASAERHSRTRP